MAEKVAVVTGSNKGIGYAIAKGLCKNFYGVVYITSRDVDRAELAVKELRKHGYRPEFHQLDITDDESVFRFRDYIQNVHGGLDILVNNAGIAFNMDATEPFSVQAEKTIDVNYFGLVRICDALFPLLRPNARVVNISSSMGHSSRIPDGPIKEKFKNPDLTEKELSTLMREFVKDAKENRHEQNGWGKSAYVISKNGVSALTIIQQKFFDKTPEKNIIVNAVHPGYVQTDLTNNKGDWTIEQGAVAPLYLALLPENENKVKGCYVWKDKRLVDWRSGETAMY